MILFVYILDAFGQEIYFLESNLTKLCNPTAKSLRDPLARAEQMGRAKIQHCAAISAATKGPTGKLPEAMVSERWGCFQGQLNSV